MNENKNLAMQTDHASAALVEGISVKGHSRSLEMEPLDRSYTTYY